MADGRGLIPTFRRREMKYMHLNFGKREWELQAFVAGRMVNYSGPPYLTRGEARRGLEAPYVPADLRAVNVRTGDRL